tara:strand:+ start:2282 stop:3229 length:948 start_codon:yes stop_codon:yes gene_type:complete
MSKAGLSWVMGIALLVVLALSLDGYAGDLYRKLLLTAALCLSFNYLFGISGQLAFSHIAFYGIGAYGVVILTYKVGLPLPLAIVGAAVVCGLLSFVVAVPATRLKGFYLALATLAFAQLFNVLLLQGGDVTGGPEGISGFSAKDYFGLPSTGSAYTVVIVMILIFTFTVLLLLDQSWFGRACRAIRDNEAAAEAMGINIFRTKVAAFMISSTLAGVAGIAYAFADNYVNPIVFSLEPLFLLLFMVIVGGTGRHAGAILGAVVLFLAPEVLEAWVGRHYLLGFGLIMVLVILFLPTGLIGLVDRINSKFWTKAVNR